MIDAELRLLLTNAVGDRRDEIRLIMKEVADMRAEIKALRIENNQLKQYQNKD